MAQELKPLVSSLGEEELFDGGQDLFPVFTLCLVEKVLGLRAQGYTNIKAALTYAMDELKRHEATRPEEGVAILLSDGEPTVGGSPLDVAKRFHGLHVIGFPRSVKWICQTLVKNGSGKCVFVNNVRDIPNAINHVLKI